MLKTVFVILRSLQDSLLLWHFSLLSSVDNKIVVAKVMVPAFQNEKDFFLKKRGKKKKRLNKTKPERRWGGRRGKWGREMCQEAI